MPLQFTSHSRTVMIRFSQLLKILLRTPRSVAQSKNEVRSDISDFLAAGLEISMLLLLLLLLLLFHVLRGQQQPVVYFVVHRLHTAVLGVGGRGHRPVGVAVLLQSPPPLLLQVVTICRRLLLLLLLLLLSLLSPLLHQVVVKRRDVAVKALPTFSRL